MYVFNFIIFVLFSVCFTQASYSAESEKDYLVVGSCRQEGAVNLWWKRIAGNEIDFTHKTTYNGKATTLDLEPSAIPGLSHIQADAKTYNPGSQRIRDVFMELFPSSDIRKAGATEGTGNNPEEELEKMRLMPDVIRNLSLYMLPGSHLEIEHIPHFTLFDSDFYVSFISYMRKENPFHFFISPLFMDNIKSRNFIGIPGKTKHWEQVKAQKLSEGWTLENTNAIISEAAGSHPTLLHALSSIQGLLGFDENLFNKRVNVEIENYEKDAGKFYLSFHNTLSSVIAQEFCLLSQQDSIREFLKQTGFDDIHIAHQENNPYNGRKNTWMISAIKK